MTHCSAEHITESLDIVKYTWGRGEGGENEERGKLEKQKSIRGREQSNVAS